MTKLLDFISDNFIPVFIIGMFGSVIILSLVLDSGCKEEFYPNNNAALRVACNKNAKLEVMDQGIICRCK